MTRATAGPSGRGDAAAVPRPRVALVARDPQERLALAAAFDGAPPSWDVELHDDAPAGADVVVSAPGSPVAGSVAFDLADPRATVARVAAALGARSALVVVTSPVGGAGATSVALHLAASAAARASLCVVDGEGGARARLGLDPSARTWAARAEDEPLETVALPVAGGFRLLIAAGPPAALEEAVAAAAGGFDAVIADARTLSDALLARARAGVLVLPPTVPAARRARALGERFGVGWTVVTNRLGPGGEVTRPELEEVLGRRISLELPCCPALRDAEDEDRLLRSAWTRWRRRVDRLAHVLLP